MPLMRVAPTLALSDFDEARRSSNTIEDLRRGLATFILSQPAVQPVSIRLEN